MLLAYYSEHLQTDPFELGKLFFEEYLILNVRTTFRLQKLRCETYGGNTLKIKAVSAIQVIKNKKQCFQLCLDRTCTLVLSVHFLRSPIGRVSKIARLKKRAPRNVFVHSWYFEYVLPIDSIVQCFSNVPGVHRLNIPDAFLIYKLD